MGRMDWANTGGLGGANSLGKKTEDLFVLDFYNSTENLKKSFDPFYTATSLSKATDINVLHELKSSLDLVGVYEWGEVEDFVEKYFKGLEADKYLSPIIQIAEERFNNSLELDDKAKADYKIKAKQFVKIYGQMASIMPYEVLNWEKLFWFLKFLIPKMIITDPEQDALDELLNSVGSTSVSDASSPILVFSLTLSSPYIKITTTYLQLIWKLKLMIICNFI